jgi:alcohol dehydrogenase (cytochrome c)
MASGGHPAEEAIPLVADGIMYIEDGLSKVSAIDVRSGDGGTFLWRFDPEITSYRNRKGVALFEDAVHSCAGMPRAISLDINTGEVLYDTDLHAPVQPGTTLIPEIINQTMTGPPLVVTSAAGRNIHVCGRAGEHAGNHSIDAVDADTGEFLWRRYSVPAPGEPGHETWENDAWQITSIGFWGAHTWDPSNNILMTGLGDAWPSYDPEFRPGDNLFTASTIALDVDTGDIKWYFQYVPNERYDSDHSNNQHLWTDADGRLVLSTFTRGGMWYKFDVNASMAGGIANAQEVDLPQGAFISAHQFTDELTWTKGIDPKTGMPIEYDPARSVQGYNDYPDGGTLREHIGEARYHCPDWGSQSVGFAPSVLDRDRGMAYTMTNDSCVTGNYITEVHPFEEVLAGGGGTGMYTGATPEPCCWDSEGIEKGFGLVAMNIETGERNKLAKFENETNNQTGLLGTAGGLLMTGWPGGKVAVYDKDTGAELWHFNVGSRLGAAAMTYAVDGKQYFAILSGGSRGSVSGAPGAGDALGGNPNIWVFGLRD